MGILNGLLRFVMLGPLALGLIAAAFFGIGYYLQIEQNEKFARNARLLAAGMPGVVDVQSYDRDMHRTEAGEVHLRAQILPEHGYELVIEESIGEARAVMIPFVSTDSTTREVLGVMLWTGPGFDFTDVSDGRIFAKLEGRGDFGSIVRINGRGSSLGKWEGIVADALRDEGLSLPENPVVVFPYLGGRHANLPTSSDATMSLFGIFSKIGGAIGLLALFKLVFRPRDDKPEDDPLDAIQGTAPAPAPFYETAPVAPQAMAGADGEVPLWKQRLNARIAGARSDTTTAQPDPAAAVLDGMSLDLNRPAAAGGETAPTAGKTLSTEQIATPPRRRSGLDMLRRGLTVVVGGAFALVLIAVLAGLVQDAMAHSTEEVRVLSQQEVAAQRMAEEILPSADSPTNALLDIDVTPVAHWALTTFFLATMGDTTAIIILLSIMVGIAMSGFVLRYFFMVRAMAPRTRVAADLTDMGFE